MGIDFSKPEDSNIKVSAFARFTGLSESYIRSEINDGRIKAATYGRGKKRFKSMVVIPTTVTQSASTGVSWTTVNWKPIKNVTVALPLS